MVPGVRMSGVWMSGVQMLRVRMLRVRGKLETQDRHRCPS